MPGDDDDEMVQAIVDLSDEKGKKAAAKQGGGPCYF